MPVDTGNVTGRRALQFNSLDEVVAEAERLSDCSDVELLGNWSLGQIFQHLGDAMAMAIDGSDYKPPFFFKIMGPLMRKGMLNKSMRAGFQLPPGMHALIPSEDTTTESGFKALRQNAERLKNEELQPRHVVFGKMTREDWNKLHLRHAEMHLSFAVPSTIAADSEAAAS
jgi:hypothetical protein